MKRIGIITLNGYINYGNRLQNYALEQVLKSLNYKVETILVKESNLNALNRSPKKDFIGILKSIVAKALYFPHRIIERKYINKKKQRLKAFSNEYINETDYFISGENINSKVLKKFDYFVTGSDQVWNPYYNYLSSLYFLSFTEKHKRISYAASFGISELPKECVPRYRKWLSEMAHLSIREEAGAKLIKELTGREAKVVLDPTLMLTKEQWLSISKQSSNKPGNKYLLTYFLGSVSKENKIKIKKIAKEKDLEIIHLANIKDKNTYIADPSEFIDYINSADMFLTDSFHGAVFSIILKKPFVVFKRQGSIKSMNSRIETLLSMFQLKDRKWENISAIADIYNVDYSNIEIILDRERKKSLQFLEESLEQNA